MDKKLKTQDAIRLLKRQQQRGVYMLENNQVDEGEYEAWVDVTNEILNLAFEEEIELLSEPASSILDKFVAFLGGEIYFKSLRRQWLKNYHLQLIYYALAQLEAQVEIESLMIEEQSQISLTHMDEEVFSLSDANKALLVIDLYKLVKIMERRFNLTELEKLAFQLGIDFEEVAGKNPKKSEAIREIVMYENRQVKLVELVNVLAETWQVNCAAALVEQAS